MTPLLVKCLVFKKNFERKKSCFKLLKLFRFCSYWALLIIEKRFSGSLMQMSVASVFVHTRQSAASYYFFQTQQLFFFPFSHHPLKATLNCLTFLKSRPLLLVFSVLDRPVDLGRKKGRNVPFSFWNVLWFGLMWSEQW